MGLSGLIEEHGIDAKFKKGSMAGYVTIIAQDGGEFWVKTESGKRLTIDEDNASSGWSIYVKPIQVSPVKCCVWRYIGNPDKIIRYEFREGVNPWVYFSEDAVKSKLKYWYKCDDEDQTLMVTQ